MQILKKLIFLLSPRERKNALLLLGMIIVMALLDVIGVASILPFMAVLMNPDTIETNTILNKMFQIAGTFGIENNQQFLFALGTLVFVLLIVSLVFKALVTYLQIHFALMRDYSIGKRLVEGYLRQPYSWFLNRHSADLGRNILSEVTKVVGTGIAPMITLIAHGAVAIALMILLILTDPKLALVSFFTLGLFYGLVYRFTRSILKRLGQQTLQANRSRFSEVSEAFGAVKEVKVSRLEQFYIQRFTEPARNYSRYQAMAGSISQLPRYIIEIVTFGGMLFLVLFLLSKNNDFASVIPVITLYAFAGYRLLPSLQQIYISFTKLRFIVPALDAIIEDLINLPPVIHSKKNETSLQFNKGITLSHIYYHYPNTSRTALYDINLSIPTGTTVGLVGATGSGKTTTVDIILGLLEAQQGELKVDGKIINKQNCRAWQSFIGYVPQQIFLADDTVAANIAFGNNPKDIDQVAVEYAAKAANLHDFIISELDQQYQTKVGERGIRLSGGQRQRIGIARALYRRPKVLILDEATSALDNLTEKEVMNEVHKISKNITVIMIAHRLSTVKNCDRIYLLENGKLKEQGTFDELINLNDQFRDNAKDI